MLILSNIIRMKQKLKQYLKTGILFFGLCFFAVNCQKDDDLKDLEIEGNKIESQYKISKFGKVKLSSNTKLKVKLEKLTGKLEKNRQAKNKTLYSSNYDFYINTDYATYIESIDKTYHSYTFLIERVEEVEVLENLLVSLQPDGSYKTMFITYNITAQEKEEFYNGIPFDLENTVESYTINDSGLITDIFNKETACPRVILDCCLWGNPKHPFGIIAEEPGVLGDRCPQHGTCYYDGVCEGDGGGTVNMGDTDGTEDPSNTNTDTTNPNGGGNPEDATTPTPPCRGDDCPQEYDPIHQKNCEELQALLDVHPDSIPPSLKTLKEAIAELKGELSGKTEEGFTIRKTSSFPPALDDVPENKRGEGFCKYASSANVTGGVHIHVDNSHPDLDSDYEPMFSHGDIKDLLVFTQTYNNPNNPPDSSIFTHILVTYQGTYALKIKDLMKLQFLNNIIGSKREYKKFKRLLDSQFRRKTDQFDNPNGTPKEYQIILLRHINIQYDLGISLYKTKENSTGEPVGWEELILLNGDTANSDIRLKPCN